MSDKGNFLCILTPLQYRMELKTSLEMEWGGVVFAIPKGPGHFKFLFRIKIHEK